MTDPPGLDLDRLAAWFAAAVPGAGTLRSARLLAGGKSNLTYEVSDGSASWVVRRPPLGHVLATAHDMGREYRVMSALAGTGVPVPATYGLCQDESVLGAPFYVMQKVSGTTYRYAADLTRLGPDRVRAISVRLVDTLAALHDVDPAAVELGDFGRPAGFLARQVRRWGAQMAASMSRPLPDADQLLALLSAGTPVESGHTIVHGDYRLDNVITDEDDRLAAIIDWEMATLGDPLTDLALLVVYQRAAQMPDGDVVADASLAPGYLTEEEVISRYAAVSGRGLEHLGFYLGLACYKLAAIAEGIYYRHLQGQTVGEEGFARMGELTERMLAAGLRAAKEHH